MNMNDDYDEKVKEMAKAGPYGDAEPEIFACNSKFHNNTYQNLVETFVTNRQNLSEDQLSYVVSRLFPTYSHIIIGKLKEINYRTRHLKSQKDRDVFVTLFKELHKRANFSDQILTEFLKDACKRVYEDPNIADREDNPVALLFNCGAKLTIDITKDVMRRWKNNEFKLKENKNASYNEKMFLLILSKVTKNIYKDLIKNSYNLSFVYFFLMNNDHLEFTIEDVDSFIMAFHSQTINPNFSYIEKYCQSISKIEKSCRQYKDEKVAYQFYEQNLRKYHFNSSTYYSFVKTFDGTKVIDKSINRISLYAIHNEKCWRYVIYTGTLDKSENRFSLNFSVKLKEPENNKDAFLASLIQVIQRAIALMDRKELNSNEVNDFIKDELKKELKTQYLLLNL